MLDKRNKRCPCGSGKKYKKCCGSGGRDVASTSGLRTREDLNKSQAALELFQRGEAAVAQGKLDEAAGCFRQAIAYHPHWPEAQYILGVICHTLGELSEAIACFHKVIALNPGHADALFNLGMAYYDRDELDQAIGSFRQLLKLNPGDPEAHFNLGSFLMSQGKLEEAAGSFRQALALKHDYVEAYCNLGGIFNELGKRDDAVACFRQAISYKPNYARAYKALSLSMKYTKPDQDVQAMESLYNQKETSETDRINLGFALGRVYEQLGQHDRSFDFLLQANLLKRKAYHYSIQDDYDLFARIKNTFTPAFFASYESAGNQDNTPIFILGMPRSGTTLVEQIIASHSLVFGAGELPVLGRLIKFYCKYSNLKDFPECFTSVDINEFENLGSNYIKIIRQCSKLDQHITDKMPHNFIYVGLIKIILPNAKVIHCVRNPMDTCFSIFKSDFKDSHAYAYDMVELGSYYNLYLDLMAHWGKVLPGFMHTVKYEDIVSDQKNQTKCLLDFCGLPWDDACLDFYKTTRRVETSSFAQVRQPIYKDSVELWKRFEKHLEPLRKAIYR